MGLPCLWSIQQLACWGLCSESLFLSWPPTYFISASSLCAPGDQVWYAIATLHHSFSPCTGCQWLLKSASRNCYWPTELWRDQPFPISRPSLKPYTPACALHSASANRLATPSLRVGPRYPSKTRLFAIRAPKWLNELPIDIRTAETLHIFRCKLKTHLLRLYIGK